MPVELERLAWEDKIKLTLRALYEQYGFRQYRMGKFEPYDMYYEHKDFLKSETVITFTDTAGRLMALKPDVTMSIVKGTQPDDDSRKLYYIENVFRMAPGSREYGENAGGNQSALYTGCKPYGLRRGGAFCLRL